MKFNIEKVYLKVKKQLRFYTIIICTSYWLKLPHWYNKSVAKINDKVYIVVTTYFFDKNGNGTVKFLRWILTVLNKKKKWTNCLLEFLETI